MPTIDPAKVIDVDGPTEAKLEDAWKKLHRLARSVHRLTDEVRSTVHHLRSADGVTYFDIDALDDTKFIKASRRLGSNNSGLHTPKVGQVKDMIKVAAVAASMLSAADSRIPEILDPTLIEEADIEDLRTWLDAIGR